MEDPECELVGPFRTKPPEPWHSKRARHNAKPVPLSSSLRGSAYLCKLKNSQNNGEIWPPREIFISIKTNYHLLAYIKLYCHLSILRLSTWSFIVFLLRMLCVSLTKIWHKLEPILVLEKVSKTLKQKTLTNSKIFHVLEVLSFKEYEKGKAIQTWVGKKYFVSGANYLTKGASLIILNT